MYRQFIGVKVSTIKLARAHAAQTYRQQIDDVFNLFIIDLLNFEALYLNLSGPGVIEI